MLISNKVIERPEGGPPNLSVAGNTLLTKVRSQTRQSSWVREGCVHVHRQRCCSKGVWKFWQAGAQFDDGEGQGGAWQRGQLPAVLVAPPPDCSRAKRATKSWWAWPQQVQILQNACMSWRPPHRQQKSQHSQQILIVGPSRMLVENGEPAAFRCVS